MSRALRPEDMGIAIAWLDGELPEAEAQRFERRLAAEPELARAVESFASTDDLLRWRAARGSATTHPVRSARRPWIPVLLAAAAAAFVVVALALRRDGARELDFDVALVPCDESAQEFVDAHDALRGLRPAGLEELRAVEEHPNVDASEFLHRALAVLDEAASNAPAEAPRAGFFAIPLTVPAEAAPCEVVVIAIPETGRELRLFPEAREPGAIETSAPKDFEAGRRWLPRAPFRIDASQRVRYSRGFLVPVGSRSLVVLVALRPLRSEARDAAPIDALERERALREVPRGAQVVEVERWSRLLESEGFTVRALRVGEP